MADKLCKVYPDNALQRKPTRDTDNYSEGGSCEEAPPSRNHQHVSNHDIIHPSQRAIRQAMYCRICLEGQQSGNSLLDACQCRDLIHHDCLLEWVQHRIEGNVDVTTLSCQVCKGTYTVIFEPKHCFTCEIGKPKYKKYRWQFTKSLFGVLIVMVIFLMIIVLLFKIYLQNGFCENVQALLALPKNTIVAILVMMLIFLGIFTVGLGYRLVLHYCYGVKWQIAPRAV